MFEITATVGNPTVHITNGRTRTATEIAEIALHKVIYISKDTPEPLKMQAEAFKEQLLDVLVGYIESAKLEERNWAANIAEMNDCPAVAEMIRKHEVFD